MKSLGMLLNSAGKTEILRMLMHQSTLVGLRQAARYSGIHPHSAEVALAALVRQGLARRTRTPGRILYELVKDHEDVPILEAVFDAAEIGFIKARGRALDDRARQILPFIAAAAGMIKRGRESCHVD